MRVESREFRGERMEIFRKSMLMIKEVYKISFPKDEVYGIQSQIRRAAVSVKLNLEEGNVFKDKRKITHFERALGSLHEVIACLEIYESVIPYPSDTKMCMGVAVEVRKMLRSLINSQLSTLDSQKNDRTYRRLTH